MREEMMELLERVHAYNHGDPKRIQHLMKVYTYAALIGKREQLSEAELFVLESAAILHDIGIHESEHKYGSSAGKYQEIEGPAIAESILEDMGGYTEEQIERIQYLIGHHHTYQNIEGMDYQILVEADFLVNLYEDLSKKEVVQNVKEKIFKTKAGTKLLCQMFDV